MIWDDLLMQGRSRLDRELLDAEMIAGHLVPPGSVFAFLAAHRAELFPDSFTADLFPSRTGRPSLPADLVGAVLVLKELYDLSDTQTADALKFDTMRKVARVVPGAGEVIAAVCGLDYSRPGKPDIDWDDPQAKEQLVSDLVNDALAVLAGLAVTDAPERDAAEADALGLLALVAGQDVEPAEGSDGTDGRWRIARRVAPDRVISTVDREARHTRKCKSKRRDGFRGHVAAEPDSGLITDCEMTMAAGPGSAGAEGGVKMAARDRFRGTGAGAPAGQGGAAAESDAAGQAGPAPAAAPAGGEPVAATG